MGTLQTDNAGGGTGCTGGATTTGIKLNKVPADAYEAAQRRQREGHMLDWDEVTLSHAVSRGIDWPTWRTNPTLHVINEAATSGQTDPADYLTMSRKACECAAKCEPARSDTCF